VPEFDDDGAVVSVLGVGRDVTTVVRQREELERASRTDSLTGAANRRVLYDVLPEAVVAAERTGRRVALILADLDGFKHLNDLYGTRSVTECCVQLRLRSPTARAQNGR
jgi:GGDEF domain-containing protein